MNYLAHMALAGPTDESLVGNLLGDFLKGLDVERLPAGVRRGIRDHQAIDAFTDRDATVVRARLRLDERFTHLRRVLLDVFFDHFLAAHWDALMPDTALPDLTTRVYRALELHAGILPERLARMRPRMEAEDWLGAYRTVEHVERVLTAMERRLRKPRPLGEGGLQLRVHYDTLEADFLEFFPRLAAFAGDRN